VQQPATHPENPGAQLAPILLTRKESARLLNMSERTFCELRSAPWMPRPAVLGPRLLRWSRAELEKSLQDMPRLDQPMVQPPAIQRRNHINALKAGAAA